LFVDALKLGERGVARVEPLALRRRDFEAVAAADQL
jgi:hypothetical protein